MTFQIFSELFFSLDGKASTDDIRRDLGTCLSLQTGTTRAELSSYSLSSPGLERYEQDETFVVCHPPLFAETEGTL